MLVNFNKIHLVYQELLKSKKWNDAVKKYKSSKIILYYGHGGNLGVTDHAAIDLTRLTKNKKIGFSLGSSIQTTSLINDDSFENLFKNWIAIHLESFKKNKKEICCIGVTSSGKSKNFHTALNFIKKNNLKSIYFTAVRLDKNEKFPVSEQIYKYGLYLPSGIGNTFKEIKEVVKQLKIIFKN